MVTNCCSLARSLVSLPVFDSFENDKVVKGLLFVYVYWRTYFDDLLPPGADGIYVVLENTCNQQYTYQVDGVRSKFIGHGDLHDEKYEYLGTGTSVANIITGQYGDSFSHAEAEQGGCDYSIRVYPSQQFEDDRRTNQPYIYATILAALFVFTSAIFLLYDYMVERRQKIVLHSAQQSGKLVSSLFPEAVRDQLYNEQETAKPRERTFVQRTRSKQTDSTDDIKIGHKKAIASLYPETTIFFADIAGFTQWSSTRTPSDVFTLLETLYGSFDSIAAKRKVFKGTFGGDSLLPWYCTRRVHECSLEAC